MGKKDNWKKISTRNKILSILTIVLSIAVVIIEIVGISGKGSVKQSNSIAIPMLGVITLLNAILNYNKSRTIGIVCFICAAIIFICTAIVFMGF